MFRSRFIHAALVAAAVSLVAPARSEAGFMVTISNGADPPIVVTDNGPGDTDNALGYIQITNHTAFNGTYDLNVTTHENMIGTTGAENNVNTISIRSTSAGALPLTITTVTDTFTNIPTPTVGLIINSLAATSLTGTVQGSTVVSTAASNPSTVSLTGSGNGAISVESTRNSPISGPFTITSQMVFTTLTVGSVANVTITSSVTYAAPAPAGFVMLATALPFAGLLRRRLGRSEAATDA